MFRPGARDRKVRVCVFAVGNRWKRWWDSFSCVRLLLLSSRGAFGKRVAIGSTPRSPCDSPRTKNRLNSCLHSKILRQQACQDTLNTVNRNRRVSVCEGMSTFTLYKRARKRDGFLWWVVVNKWLGAWALGGTR